MKSLRKLGLLLLAASITAVLPGCGDEYRPVANPIIQPGGQPQNAHYAWVVNFNPNGPGSTTELDVSGDTNLAVNSMGLGSISEGFPASSLALFVANRDNDTVSEYLPTLAGAITTISLLSGSRPVFVNSALAGTMYVLNSGPNSACPNGGSVSAIPVVSLAVASTTCVGKNPTTMSQSPVSGFIYILNQGDGTISVLNPAGPAIVATIDSSAGLGPNPSTVTASADGNWIFIATQGDATHASALDILGSTGTSVAASVPLGMMPTFAVSDFALNRFYVANSGDNTVSVFDSSMVNPTAPTPIPLLATVKVGTNPIGITALENGTYFYVANSVSNNVTVVSSNSFAPLASIALPPGANPVWIASDPSSSKVYVADQSISMTTIIQTVNNTVSANISAPPQISTCTSSCALQQPLMIVTD
jgi:DNA-binding beta-propeller fold protein YncE